MSLHMLGAPAASGLRSQVVLARVDRVDGEVLRRKLAESGGSNVAVPLVLYATNAAPKAVLDVALPVAAKQLEQYGIYATLRAADASSVDSKAERAHSEFFTGAAVGGAAVATVLGVGWASWRLLFRRIFT